MSLYPDRNLVTSLLLTAYFLLLTASRGFDYFLFSSGDEFAE